MSYQLLQMAARPLSQKHFSLVGRHSLSCGCKGFFWSLIVDRKWQVSCSQYGNTISLP